MVALFFTAFNVISLFVEDVEHFVIFAKEQLVDQSDFHLPIPFKDVEQYQLTV